ncbi:MULTISPECIES: hypothetical protein [Haloarcula]|uniref:hypothetical protein n=1 Tax=Haloarcula TaxID=2237 RepID=UPI0023ED9AE4|nr:hypothetical protein [Halomicroarcula sp. XH51]
MSRVDDTDSGARSGSARKPTEFTADDLLEEYAETWSVASDLVEAATVQHVEQWDATKEIERTLTVTESRRTISVEPSDAPSRESAVPIDERYEHAPDGFEAATVTFVDFENASLVSCTDCGGSGREACSECDRRTVVECEACGGDGADDCGECGGDGARTCGSCNGTGDHGDARCSRCNGTGETTCETCNATGERRCPTCDGAGDVTCPNCSGNGDVPCGTCSGTGELYETTRGTLEYEPASTFSVADASGADESWFEDVEGDRLDRTVRETPDRADEGGSATVKHEIEQRSVPVTKVTYEYGDDQYDLFEVARDLHSHSAPKSTTRRLLPLVAGLVVAAGAGYYIMFVL